MIRLLLVISAFVTISCDVEVNTKKGELKNSKFAGKIQDAEYLGHELSLTLVYEGCAEDTNFKVKLTECSVDSDTVETSCRGELWYDNPKEGPCGQIKRITEVTIENRPQKAFVLKLANDISVDVGVSIQEPSKSCPSEAGGAAPVACVKKDGEFVIVSASLEEDSCEVTKQENQVDFGFCRDLEELRGNFSEPSYDNETDLLTLTIEYSDACYPDQQILLKFEEGCQESYPAGCHAKLYHTWDKRLASRVKCQVNRIDTITVKVEEHPTDYYKLNISNKVTVLIDEREAKVCPADEKIVCIKEGVEYKQLDVSRDKQCEFPVLEGEVEMSFCQG